MESINPFQSGSVPVSDRLPINRVYDNIYSEIIKNENIAKEEEKRVKKELREYKKKEKEKLAKKNNKVTKKENN